MAGVTADILLQIKAALSGAAEAGGSPHFSTDIEKRVQIQPGTGALGVADLLFADTRQIAASGNESLDLAGVLTGPIGGAPIAAAEVVALYIEADADNVNSVVVGGGANAFVGPLGAAGTLTLKPGEWGFFSSITGWPVVAATADLLRVANGGAGTPVDYTVIVIARSTLG